MTPTNISTVQKAPFTKPRFIVEDLSFALYQANQKLELANQELKNKDTERTQMLANISHDLRSPITAIHNSIEYFLSLETYDQKDLNPILMLMKSRIVLLEKLINDLFLLSSLDFNENKLTLTKVNIGIFLEEFYFSCSADNLYKERQMILDIPTDFPYFVNIDNLMIVRVLDNLFINALKFSKKDSYIKLTAFTCGQEYVTISVSDNGIGIKEEYLSKIFDPTYMISSARTPSTTSGSGLGLSIAKSIINLHHGEIWCESEYHSGSTFYFTLPLTT